MGGLPGIGSHTTAPDSAKQRILEGTADAHPTHGAERAKQPQVSDKTIRRWIAIGVLSGYRVGPRAVRIDADELEALELRIPTRQPATAQGLTMSLAGTVLLDLRGNETLGAT